MPSKLLVARDVIKGHPATPDALLETASARASLAGRQLVESRATLIAYVNNGRWIADCPHCGSGIALDPDWSIVTCLGVGCHRVYTDLTWPAERVQIERVLATRPFRHQHWGYLRGVSRDLNMPAETIEDLERDEVERRDHFAHLRGRQ